MNSAGETGLLVGVFDAHRLAIDDGQLMAELVANVTLVADLVHRPDEVTVVAVGLLADDPVVPLETADRAVGRRSNSPPKCVRTWSEPTACAPSRIPAVLRSGMRGASRQSFKCGESTSSTILQEIAVIC